MDRHPILSVPMFPRDVGTATVLAYFNTVLSLLFLRRLKKQESVCLGGA